MIKAIIFDCFGVIYPDILAMVQGHFLDPSDHVTRLKIKQLRRQSDAGLLDRHDFWDKAAELLGITRDRLDLELDKVRGADWQLLDFISDLRASYKTALLSNVGRGFLEQIFDETHPQNDYFDEVVVSAEVGMMKPDPAIFMLTANKLGVEPKDCLVIDDKQIHVDGARATGMQAMLYEDFGQMKADLEKLLNIP